MYGVFLGEEGHLAPPPLGDIVIVLFIIYTMPSNILRRDIYYNILHLIEH